MARGVGDYKANHITTVGFDDADYRALREFTHRFATTKAGIIREALRDFVKKHEHTPPRRRKYAPRPLGGDGIPGNVVDYLMIQALTKIGK